MSDVAEHDESTRIVRVLHDSTDPGRLVKVVPNTHDLPSAQEAVDVVPVLPGSAYDRGPKV